MNEREIFDNEILRVSEIAYLLINNSDFKEEFLKDPDKALIGKNITLKESRAYIMQQVISLGFTRLESFSTTMAVAERFKESIKTSLEQIENGYKGAMWMYWIAFITGVLMIITAIVFAFIKEKSLLSIVFGSLGTLDLLVFFFMKPPLELQNSRIGFARLEAAFTTWFIDLNNLNSILGQMNSVYVTTSKNAEGVLQQTVKQEDFEHLYKKSLEISSFSMNNVKTTLDIMGTILREGEKKKNEVD